MNKQDYTAGLELLKTKDPLNSMIDIISRGFTRINMLYLAAELKNLPKDDKSEDDKPDYSSDPNHKKICRNISTLYGARARLSNLFHDCEDDNQRANLSSEIQGLQEQIIKQRRAKDFYEKHQRHIDPEMTHYEIPQDPVELIKKRNSLRSAISRHKAHIEQASALKDHKKVDQINRKLIEKQTHLSYVVKAIDQKDL